MHVWAYIEENQWKRIYIHIKVFLNIIYAQGDASLSKVLASKPENLSSNPRISTEEGAN